jgi:hypothetical protein
MYAPVGQRWTLAIVRWWGGWAEGEHVSKSITTILSYYSPFIQRDTLIRYLLDELHSYEEDHSDALCPVQREAHGSLFGEHVLVQPVATQEVRLMHTSIHSDMKGMQNEIGSVKTTINQMTTAMNTFMGMHLSQPSRELCNQF